MLCWLVIAVGVSPGSVEAFLQRRGKRRRKREGIVLFGGREAFDASSSPAFSLCYYVVVRGNLFIPGGVNGNLKGFDREEMVLDLPFNKMR